MLMPGCLKSPLLPPPRWIAWLAWLAGLARTALLQDRTFAPRILHAQTHVRALPQHAAPAYVYMYPPLLNRLGRSYTECLWRDVVGEWFRGKPCTAWSHSRA